MVGRGIDLLPSRGDPVAFPLSSVGKAGLYRQRARARELSDLSVRRRETTDDLLNTKRSCTYNPSFDTLIDLIWRGEWLRKSCNAYEARAKWKISFFF